MGVANSVTPLLPSPFKIKKTYRFNGENYGFAIFCLQIQ